jgi:alkylation response protein AidB-like acyl-CoA dehydrogenase
MPRSETITRPDSSAFDDLCQQLAQQAPDLEKPGAWPDRQLAACARFGVYEWFLPAEYGGQAWSNADVIQGYLRLSEACLTTTFVITQLMGACRRIVHGDLPEDQKRAVLPELLSAARFATVGISHLTTSRRYLDNPVLKAEDRGDHFVLDGYSPWVTGAPHADDLVVGATLDDGRQILTLVATGSEGLQVGDPAQLVGLSASQTGPVQFRDVQVPREGLIAGPVENVMQRGVGGAAGGLQTSTLAVGLAGAALTFVEGETARRRELSDPAQALRAEWQRLRQDLVDTAAGLRECPTEQLRQRANSLVLRSTQAALASAKGAGYLIGHPAGRWCREALFFLVWSCPQPVLAANLCEFSGIADD